MNKISENKICVDKFLQHCEIFLVFDMESSLTLNNLLGRNVGVFKTYLYQRTKFSDGR
jgi:hypothetical protein